MLRARLEPRARRLAYPRRKISMIRIGPQQQGRGSRKMSEMISPVISSASLDCAARRGCGSSRCWSCDPNWQAGRSAGCGGNRLAKMDQKAADGRGECAVQSPQRDRLFFASSGNGRPSGCASH